jgi:hypothetical protein
MQDAARVIGITELLKRKQQVQDFRTRLANFFGSPSRGDIQELIAKETIGIFGGNKNLIEHSLNISPEGVRNIEPFLADFAVVEYRDGNILCDKDVADRFLLAQMRQFYENIRAANFNPKFLSYCGEPVEFIDDYFAKVDGRLIIFGREMQVLKERGLENDEYLWIGRDGPIQFSRR